MANKKITLVFQDCVLCGDRGKKVKKIIAEKGIVDWGLGIGD